MGEIGEREKEIEVIRGIIISILVMLVSFPLAANEPEPSQNTPEIHWAFASFLGTGWYKVDDSRSVFLLRIPPRQTVRESWFNSRDDRQIGIEIKYTTTLGLFSLDDPGEFTDSDNLGTFSFTPGVELEIPVSRDFYLRPFAHLGWGTEFEYDSSAWVWFGGIKSRYRLPRYGEKLAIISNLYYGGFNSSDQEDDDMSGIALGLEGSIPLNSWTHGDSFMDLDWHVMYTWFSNAPLLTAPENDPIPLEQMLEIGIGLAPRDQRWDLWLWKPERLGFGVKWDPNSDFLALTINFTSWFRR